MAKDPCPHCGKIVDYHMLTQHAGKCPANPKVRAAIAAILVDAESSGFAVTVEKYEKRRQMEKRNVCSARTLQLFFGSWADACAAFGVKPPEWSHEHRGTCPYCGIESRRNRIAYHMERCLQNPALHDAVVDALQGAQPGEGVARNEYVTRVAQNDKLPSARVLSDTYGGTWEDVLAHFGLSLVRRAVMIECPVCGRQVARGGYGMHIKACNGGTEEEKSELLEVANEREMRRIEKRLLRDDAKRAGSFTVCRMQPAPGLYINGRECVRLELR